jgi:hypothetical protein
MQGLYQRPEYSVIYPVLCGWKRQTSRVYPYEERDGMNATRILSQEPSSDSHTIY